MNNEDLIPPGRYAALALSGEMGMTSTGKEQVCVVLEVNSPSQYAGEKLYWYGYFTDKAAERTLESLEYCGWSSGRIGDLSGIDGSHEVQVVVEHEQDQNGNTRAKPRWINRANSSGIKRELDKGGIASLEQRIKGIQLARGAAPAPQRKVANDDPF